MQPRLRGSGEARRETDPHAAGVQLADRVLGARQRLGTRGRELLVVRGLERPVRGLCSRLVPEQRAEDLDLRLTHRRARVLHRRVELGAFGHLRGPQRGDERADHRAVVAHGRTGHVEAREHDVRHDPDRLTDPRLSVGSA